MSTKITIDSAERQLFFLQPENLTPTEMGKLCQINALVMSLDLDDAIAVLEELQAGLKTTHLDYWRSNKNDGLPY